MDEDRELKFSPEEKEEFGKNYSTENKRIYEERRIFELQGRMRMSINRKTKIKEHPISHLLEYF